MKNISKRKLLSIVLSVIFSVALAFLFPSNISHAKTVSGVKLNQEKTIINQKITSIKIEPTEITKVYYKGDLVGVLTDSDLIDNTIIDLQNNMGDEAFKGAVISLDDEVYTMREESFWNYENKDKEIIEYLTNNELFVVQAYKVDICQRSNDKIIDSIYVKSQDDFLAALKRFALVFVDEAVFEKLENNEVIPTLTTYGNQDVNVYIDEVIKSVMTGAPTSEILTSEDEIFDYLCYGKNAKLTYYTVNEYDTIQGIAYQYGITGSQLLALNSDLHDLDQTLMVGQQLNVTYFTSPISVVVEQQRFTQKVTYPDSPKYESDASIATGEVVETVAPVNGYNDCLYTDIYVNGELSSYRMESEVVVAVPIQGVYHVGIGGGSYSGGIQFRLPCENPRISCDYYGYQGHTGVDFINPYDRYGAVLCCATGVVTQNAYSAAAGNFYRINCGYDSNGDEIVVRYGHMNVPGFFDVGVTVYAGQVIGQIGNTGKSTGPHVHISIYVNGIQVNPCEYLPCNLAPKI